MILGSEEDLQVHCHSPFCSASYFWLTLIKNVMHVLEVLWTKLLLVQKCLDRPSQLSSSPWPCWRVPMLRLSDSLHAHWQPVLGAMVMAVKICPMVRLFFCSSCTVNSFRVTDGRWTVLVNPVRCLHFKSVIFLRIHKDADIIITGYSYLLYCACCIKVLLVIMSQYALRILMVGIVCCTHRNFDN